VHAGTPLDACGATEPPMTPPAPLSVRPRSPASRAGPGAPCPSRVPLTRGCTRHSSGRGDVLSPCAFIVSGMTLAAVPGVALQWRGSPHRADSDGEDRSRRPDVTV
jgi:hypothetical protein